MREQRQLLPESLDELLSPDDPVRVFDKVLGRLDLSAFLVEVDAIEGRAGRPALCPRMLLLIWLYATSRGIGSAREVERLSTTDLSFRWAFGGVQIGRTTLAAFRVSHEKKLQKLFTDVLAQLVAAKVVDVDFLAIDGVRLRANAGDGSFRRRGSLEEIREQACLHVKAVLAEKDDPTTSKRVKRAREAKAKDFSDRAEQAIAAISSLQEKLDAKSPSQRGNQPRASTTDPAARVMKHGRHEFAPGFNAQIAVAGAETGGPRTIVGVVVSNKGTDQGGVSTVIDDVEKRTGKTPAAVTADKGFLKKECVNRAHARGTLAFISKPNRPIGPTKRPRKKTSAAMTAWKALMDTAAAQQALRRRSGLVELPFAWWRARFKIRQLPVRGTEKVTSVVVLASLVFNILQHRHTLTA